ncbi:hypothetical protein Scep_001027 [Stephania cephalantha]|uniref:Pseudouridine synthase RsuA/RluA-like domain-containing protein n=1 Tax=Stephania cephalantha TaxID=152367 RepID=A0AAP0Q7B3_9MAGN
MAETIALFRRASLRSSNIRELGFLLSNSIFNEQFAHQYTTTSTISRDDSVNEKNPKMGKWFTLPPFSPTPNASSVAKILSESRVVGKRSGEATPTSITALKWVLHCCPKLPRSLVQKLFRLRQVRRESIGSNQSTSASDSGTECQDHRLKRVSAKDGMNVGDVIFLPVTVQEFPSHRKGCTCNEDEIKYIHSLEIHKDSAIIVINKPPGMPVQGGSGIIKSLDMLGATYLRSGSSEPPRLVHRLDRDSSGILVMARTQASATLLHSIFREKTFAASINENGNAKRILQRKYWALVIGVPRRAKGVISAPLGKVVLDGGKSERITVVSDANGISSQHAVTEYRVIETSSDGYSWLELCPLTGRKHQLRVHCAEYLGTPIVGDYKYGWQAHRNWIPVPSPLKFDMATKYEYPSMDPFGLNLESGSVAEKQPRLHLHCRQMGLPNASMILQKMQAPLDCDLSKLGSQDFVAPLPWHMQRSWDILCS